MNSVRKLLCLAFVLGLVGCAAVEKESTPRTPDRPEPGKALVFFYRPSKYVGSLRGLEVTEGNTTIGDLSNGSYFVYQAMPGLHKYGLNGHDEDSAAFPLAPNHIYYFRCRIHMGMWLPDYSVENVPEEQAKADILDLQRVRWTGQ